MIKGTIGMMMAVAMLWLAPMQAYGDDKPKNANRVIKKIENALQAIKKSNGIRRDQKKLNQKINKLDRKLDQEIQDRSDADAALQTQMDTKMGAMDAVDGELKEAVKQNAENQGAAYLDMQTQLQQEKEERQAADSALKSQLDQEVENRNAGYFSLQDQIQQLEARGGEGSCGPGAIPVGPICVDMYEASVWSGLDETATQYGLALADYPCNANGNDCKGKMFALSVPNAMPSRYITWFQAQQACANAGKRLLTNAEWQMAAAGTPDPLNGNGPKECNVDSNDPANSGSLSSCVSTWGVHDMVGNVWEWVADWIQGQSVMDREESSTAIYGNDQITHINDAELQGDGAGLPAALRRGGGFRQGGSAGVFALDARVAPSIVNDAIGFRCGR